MARSYEKHYSDTRFWTKCKRVVRSAGREVVEKALCLYYAMLRPETPAWAKATIVGALGYFILPFDLIPDFIPFVGYTDDLAAILGALRTVAKFVDADVKEKAMRQVEKLGLA
jgi:uncharacterized membrane protein YkvA (DUF1232 family)